MRSGWVGDRRDEARPGHAYEEPLLIAACRAPQYVARHRPRCRLVRGEHAADAVQHRHAGGPVSKYLVGSGPSGVAFGSGAVWVANSLDRTVSRVDPGTGPVETVPLGAPPGGVVATYGRVWTSPGHPSANGNPAGSAGQTWHPSARFRSTTPISPAEARASRRTGRFPRVFRDAVAASASCQQRASTDARNSLVSTTHSVTGSQAENSASPVDRLCGAIPAVAGSLKAASWPAGVLGQRRLY